MTLKQHLAVIAAADSVDALESAAQAGWAAYPRSRNRITRTQCTRGWELVDRSPAAHLIPQLGLRRRLLLCGKTFTIAAGQNAAGVRYAWHHAREWMKETLAAAGVAPDVAEKVISWWELGFPHRALRVLEAASGARDGAQ